MEELKSNGVLTGLIRYGIRVCDSYDTVFFLPDFSLFAFTSCEERPLSDTSVGSNPYHNTIYGCVFYYGTPGQHKDRSSLNMKTRKSIMTPVWGTIKCHWDHWHRRNMTSKLESDVKRQQSMRESSYQPVWNLLWTSLCFYTIFERKSKDIFLQSHAFL